MHSMMASYVTGLRLQIFRLSQVTSDVTRSNEVTISRRSGTLCPGAPDVFSGRFVLRFTR
jgi:hypothetical protein